MMSRKLQAVVFDLDGTLVDSSEFIFAAYEHVLARHNLPARTRVEIASQIGKKIEDCYAFLAPEAGANVQPLIEAHREFQSANLALIRPFARVNEVLDELRGSGLKTALLTSRVHALREALRAAGINPDEFDAIVDATMVKRGKPHPEGLEKVLKLLSMKPEQTIMVGDAAPDIQAGHAAGAAATVGVTHGFGTSRELEAAGADYLLDSLAELPQLGAGLG
jgi:HAD superfamily hydrolase (TIGR01509 family)